MSASTNGQRYKLRINQVESLHLTFVNNEGSIDKLTVAAKSWLLYAKKKQKIIWKTKKFICNIKFAQEILCFSLHAIPCVFYDAVICGQQVSLQRRRVFSTNTVSQHTRKHSSNTNAHTTSRGAPGQNTLLSPGSLLLVDTIEFLCACVPFQYYSTAVNSIDILQMQWRVEKGALSCVFAYSLRSKQVVQKTVFYSNSCFQLKFVVKNF